VTLGLSVTGGEALAKQLRKLAVSVRKKALLGVLKTAAVPIQGRAAELAPLDPVGEVHLKESIAVSVANQIGTQAGGQWAASDEFQAAVAIGPTRKAFYGLYLEYGTVKMGAKPFLRPAFDYGTDRTLTLIREGLWELLEAANTGSGVFEREAAP
jgi:HK97 gp10 family phage protein